MSDALARAMEQVNAQSVVRTVLDGLPNHVFVKDREGRYTVVNRSHAEAYGHSPEEMLGRTEEEIGAPSEEIAEWLRSDRETMDTLTDVFVPEEKFTDARGNVRWMQSHKRPIIDSDGIARQVLVVSTDITAAAAERSPARGGAAGGAGGELVGGSRDQRVRLGRRDVAPARIRGRACGFFARGLHQPCAS